MAIKLPWTPERPADPLSALLCIDCGSLICTIWMAGEITNLHMTGEAWNGLPVQLQLLRRAVSDRFPHDPGQDDGESLWGFQ